MRASTLFTQVRGKRILRTSPFGDSQKFAKKIVINTAISPQGRVTAPPSFRAALFFALPRPDAPSPPQSPVRWCKRTQLTTPDELRYGILSKLR